MNYGYNVEIQMLGECERTPELDAQIGKALGFNDTDIDEIEPYKLVALFSSKTVPLEMRELIRDVLDVHPNIFYIDVVYYHGISMLPERFVIWQGGREQNYRTRVTYEEVE